MRRNLGPETPELIAKKIQAGRGRGYLESYRPWIQVGEIRSSGEQRVVVGRKTGRSHHYLSRGESAHHLLVEFSDQVSDIREQYPVLPLAQTLDIASRIGIKHPSFSGHPTVITFDFLLTVERGEGTSGELVRSIKRSEDLVKQRVLEKLALEREICAELGYRYEIVTEKQMPPILISNLRFLWNWTFLSRALPDSREQELFKRVLCMHDFDDTLGTVLEQTAKKLNISRNLSIWMFQYCAWIKMIKLDLNVPIALTKPHAGLRINYAN